MELSSIAKYLIYIGVLLLIIGSVLYFLSKIGLGVGKLPGDILIQKGNVTFYFPLATSIIISIILTLLLSFFSRK
ncbi:MAG: DUF2905 domain-containing protein [Candidatus Melainabacteria bacterium]|nr:DUF2905 domain-containing protein [Candidatus Melainabacteria bacterium]